MSAGARCLPSTGGQIFFGQTHKKHTRPDVRKHDKPLTVAMIFNKSCKCFGVFGAGGFEF